MYPHGHHPYWCDLGPACSGDDPNHVGRTSQMFVQKAEGALKIQLSGHDDSAPAGIVVGDRLVRITLEEAGFTGSATAELSIDEVRAASILLAQYAEFASRELAHPITGDASDIRDRTVSRCD